MPYKGTLYEFVCNNQYCTKKNRLLSTPLAFGRRDIFNVRLMSLVFTAGLGYQNLVEVCSYLGIKDPSRATLFRLSGRAKTDGQIVDRCGCRNQYG